MRNSAFTLFLLAVATIPAGAAPAMLVLSDGPVIRLSADDIGVPVDASREVRMRWSDGGPLQEGEARRPDGGFAWTAPGEGVFTLYVVSKAPGGAEEVWKVTVVVDAARKAPASLRRAAEALRTENYDDVVRELLALEKDEPGWASRVGARELRAWADVHAEVSRERRRGLTLRAEGRTREAVDVLRGLVEADPSDAVVQAELGACLAELEDWAAAVPHLEAAAAADPRAETMFDLAGARAQLRRYADAWTSIHLCLKWAGKGTRLLERAADLGLQIARRLDEPEEALAEIAEWAPETPAGKRAAELIR